jgi:hypothetical protein
MAGRVDERVSVHRPQGVYSCQASKMERHPSQGICAAETRWPFFNFISLIFKLHCPACLALTLFALAFVIFIQYYIVQYISCTSTDRLFLMRRYKCCMPGKERKKGEEDNHGV